MTQLLPLRLPGWIMAAMMRPLHFAALTTLLLTACAGERNDDTEHRTPMPATLPGVYSGTFPCSNCVAIEATLWLRPDGSFFLRQRFVDDPAAGPAHGPAATYGLGRWGWDEVAAQALLRGAGPERRLSMRDDSTLELNIGWPRDQVLVRDPAEPTLGDRLALDGESAITDDGATFKECLTGLTWPVDLAGAYSELRRQHRRLNPSGDTALTTIEGHLVTDTQRTPITERLVVDRVVTMKPGRGC